MISQSAKEILLSPLSEDEADRRSYIISWLQTIGIPADTIRSEYQLQNGGAVDIYLTNRRVLFEIKKGGRLDKNEGPYELNTGGGRHESAFQQINKYINIERKREKLYIDLDDDESLDWVGIVTDCQKWWIWKWSYDPHDHKDDGKAYKNWQGTILTKHNIQDLISSFLNKKVGKEWATNEIPKVFEETESNLIKLYNQISKLRNVKIQKKLWLEQLKAGGNMPKSDIDKMFIKHTMLILISRLISNNLNRDGFVKWVTKNEVDNLKIIIDKYNWKQHTTDILRSLYQYFIPKDDRKLYGEYYTPDWLAEKICMDMIDEQFLLEQISNFTSNKKIKGILDPSCGSGTFLYQAIKHILNSKAIKNSQMDEYDYTDFISKIIYGIDIHPVAIEMSIANIKRALPNINIKNINIYQSDSLLTERESNSVLNFTGGDLPITSPGGLSFTIPNWLVQNEIDVRKFVTSACNDQELPNDVIKKLKKHDVEFLIANHNMLKKIIDKEGNGVWLWYVMNQLGSIKLINKMGIIISNPPWLTYNDVDTQSRQKEIRDLGIKLDLWVGKHVAPQFNLAMLFVDKCRTLYLNNGKSAWILPFAAMKGGIAYSKFDKKFKDKITGKYELGQLPFPERGPACVLFFNNKMPNKILRKKYDTINSNDTWEAISKKTSFKLIKNKFLSKTDQWVDSNGKPLVRNGATIFPLGLVKIKELVQFNKNNTKINLSKSTKGIWKKLPELTGIVPTNWIYDVIYSQNLMSYIIPTTSKCVLPLKNNDWDPTRFKNEFYKKIYDIYEDYKNYKNDKTNNIEKTKDLNEYLDWNKKLTKQLNRKGHYIVYNSSGNILRASRLLNNNYIIEHTCYYLKCDTKNEALFMVGILNARCLLLAIQNTKSNDRHLDTYIWRKIPIPKYDKNNKHHNQLLQLTIKAETISKNVFDTKIPIGKMKKLIITTLIETGISKQIDDVVKKILPDYIR